MMTLDRTIYVIGLIVLLFSCNQPQNGEYLSNHQVDSILKVNLIPISLIQETSYPEKRQVYPYLLENQIDSALSKLTHFSKKRKDELVKLGLEQQYRYPFNKYSLWDNILTEEEKDTLRSDRPRHWLNYYDIVHKRKNQFTRYHSLTTQEVVKWKEEGMVSTAYYDSIAIARWTADSIRSAKNHLEHLEYIKRAKAIIHPIDIKYPFGSKVLFDVLKVNPIEERVLLDNNLLYKQFTPYFKKGRDTISEDIISDKYLPPIKDRFEYWETFKDNKAYHEVANLNSNPIDYFSYRLDDIGGFEIYFYTLPYEFYEDPGDGYLTFYKRETKQAYTFLSLSEKQKKYFYIDNGVLYFYKKRQDYVFITHKITTSKNEVNVTEFLPFSESKDLYWNFGIDTFKSYYSKSYSKTYKIQDYIELKAQLKD